MKPAANGKVKGSAKPRQEKATPAPGFGEFFLEIGCEEIPAGMIANAANELQVILKKYLILERLIDDDEATTFGAPRRLVATCARVRRSKKTSGAKLRDRRMGGLR